MSDNLILDFPVLTEGSGNFLTGVSYSVEASRQNEVITIIHRLKGQSFIRELIQKKDAKFFVRVVYRDSSDRQSHECASKDIEISQDEMVATQTIPITFSYAPEITPSVVVMNDMKTSASGLSDFWPEDERLNLPKHARIALGEKLRFTGGDISQLMTIVHDKDLSDGEMKVVVNEEVGEGETPVTLKCGKDVFDELHKVTEAKPSDAIQSMRSAIITQALCAVYAYMQNLTKDKDSKDNDDEVSGVLAAHLKELNRKGEDWGDDDFDPSLAATKMRPFAIKVVKGGDDDD